MPKLSAPSDLWDRIQRDQRQQDGAIEASQRRQDQQLEAISLALRQYGVLIDALREAVGLADADWEAAVNRAIDRQQFAQLQGDAPAHEAIPAPGADAPAGE